MKLTSPQALKQFLRFRGLSYSELAEKAGCSKSLIGLLATGRRTNTGVDIAKGIAKALDVPVDSLFLPESFAVPANADRSKKVSA